MFICFDLIWAMVGLDQLPHFIETTWVVPSVLQSMQVPLIDILRKSYDSNTDESYTVVLLSRNAIIAYP